MIVSLNWLADYLKLDIDRVELEERLTLSGLNHEGTERIGDDFAIDLEVTSNRPDCLGHIGVAREIGALYDQEIVVPTPKPKETGAAASDLCQVRIDCPDLCSRYTARVIRGVKVGPSPDWLVERLRTLFQPIMRKNEQWKPVNNVVDITNYVMMENGQPLHAFDFGKLAGGQIIVREAKAGEQFEAIDHNTYELTPGMCVIADAARSVALGGVMGGAETEVSAATTDLLIEAADFAPLSIRTTARRLRLHSPSSYRFERRVDPEGIDWASRRCCEMILDIAGGELAEGVVDVGQPGEDRGPIVLRLSQLERILGIAIPTDEVHRILKAIGCQEFDRAAESVAVIPPTWRRDLTREIDLVEEVGRLHGYDNVPEDVAVPMVPSHRSDIDRVLSKVRRVLTAAGINEAMTTSVVDEKSSNAFSPWTDVEPIQASTPMMRGADLLRRSLVPSLLVSRRTNEALANPVVELFEIAKVYLPQPGKLPREDVMLALTSGRPYLQVKGIIEALLRSLHIDAPLKVVATRHDLFDPAVSAELRLGEETLGYLGEISPSAMKTFELRGTTTVAELRVAALVDTATLTPQHADLSPFPAITYDINLIADENVAWESIAATVNDSAGRRLEEVQYREIYRDAKRDGAGKKRLLFSITLRSNEGTMTGEEAEAIRDQIVAACGERHGAVLVG
jgi:phenylalanyl-tRNA synthetase beta chain